MYKYQYYVITSLGKFYFNIENSKVICDKENYNKTFAKLYRMMNSGMDEDKYLNNLIIISKNFVPLYHFSEKEYKVDSDNMFLTIYLSDDYYGAPEYVIFDNKTDQLAKSN